MDARLEARLTAMAEQTEHRAMARATAKLLAARRPSLLDAGWAPTPGASWVGVMRHSGKLEPCLLESIRDGWAYVTPLESVALQRRTGVPRRTFYKGACWVFKLSPAQTRAARAKHPEVPPEVPPEA